MTRQTRSQPSSRREVLTPRQAIAMAAFFNFTGALFGGAVAATIGKGLVDTEVVTMTTVLCAVLAAFSWNIATWWLGLPSSSSHALIGGLCGAALAAARGDWSVIKWNEGVWPKVVLPMIASPIAGFVFGALFMFLLLIALHRFTPQFVHSLFGKLQIFSAAWMAHSHGTNDAQKTMGIITSGAVYRNKGGQLRLLATLARFSENASVRTTKMGDRFMRRNDGSRNGGWWLAHHSHARPSCGEIAAGTWLRGRNHCRANHSSSELLRHSTVNNTRNLHIHHGRRGGKTFQWNPVDSGGTNCLGMGFHSSGNRPNRLHAGTRNWNALTLNEPEGHKRTWSQRSIFLEHSMKR